MKTLTTSWEQAALWFDERPVRERLLIACTAMAVTLMIAWEAVIAPVLAEQGRLDSRHKVLESEQAALLAEQSTLEATLQQDPSAQLRATLERRNQRLERLNRAINEATGQLIAPRDMVALLRRMLAAQSGLSLVSLELSEPIPVFDRDTHADAGTGEGEDAVEPLLYAHDVEIRVSGGYLDVLTYLRQLEQMDDRLGWMEATYESGEWPDGASVLRVRTLSLDAAWLGV